MLSVTAVFIGTDWITISSGSDSEGGELCENKTSSAGGLKISSGTKGYIAATGRFLSFFKVPFNSFGKKLLLISFFNVS